MIPAVGNAVATPASTGVSNVGGNYAIQTTLAHGLASTNIAALGGFRDASGNEIAALTGSFVVTVINPNQFTIPVAYAAGYSFGGSVWAKGSQLRSGELTAFDAQLALLVADKTGDALAGQYAMLGGVVASDPTSSVLTNSRLAAIETANSGARILLGDNDDVQLLPVRTRSIFISPLEAMNEYGNDGVTISSVGLGASGRIDGGIQNFWIPLSRLHDKATLVMVTLFFFPGAYFDGLLPPTVTPTLQIYRNNPSASTSMTPLASAGPAIFPTPASAASYAQTPAVGSSGNITLNFFAADVTANVGSAQIFEDGTGNQFQVTTAGNYGPGDLIPVQAIAPAAPNTFLGANTNHSAGDSLSWVGALPVGVTSASVAAGGLVGGLNAGYAQTLVWTPDAGMGVIDQSTYVYTLLLTDDNATASNGFPVQTNFAGIRLDFGNITAMTPQ